MVVPPSGGLLFRPHFTKRRDYERPDQLARLSFEQRVTYLARALAALDEEFGRIETGTSWRQYLETGELKRMAASGSRQPPDDDTRRLLKKTLDSYDAPSAWQVSLGYQFD